MRKALIEIATGKVLNVIEIAPGSAWTPPSGQSLLTEAQSVKAGIGDTWNGTVIIKAPPVIPDPLAVSHWAVITLLTPGAVKPLRVKRTWYEHEYLVDCYVSQSLVNDYQSNKVVIGDYVLVEFVDGDINQPLAVVKIFKSW